MKKKKIMCALVMACSMGLVACGTAGNAKSSAGDAESNVEEQENKYIVDCGSYSENIEKGWVEVPQDYLNNPTYSGVYPTNPIKLSMQEAKYYTVCSYNRRVIEIEEGVEFVGMGEYKVTKEEFVYYSPDAYAVAKGDNLVVIAYDDADKIIGYAFVSITNNGEVTTGKLEYCATVIGNATINDVAKRSNELMGKGILNEGMLVNTSIAAIESKNEIFTGANFQYIGYASYSKEVEDGTEDTVIVKDKEKIKQMFEVLKGMEFEESDEKHLKDEETYYFSIGEGETGNITIYVGETSIIVNRYGESKQYKKTDEIKKALDELAKVFE